jgi:hypothetical protein
MPGEGLDVNHGIYVHLLTLTKPGAMSKDIAPGARACPGNRVPARSSPETATRSMAFDHRVAQTGPP